MIWPLRQKVKVKVRTEIGSSNHILIILSPSFAFILNVQAPLDRFVVDLLVVRHDKTLYYAFLIYRPITWRIQPRDILFRYANEQTPPYRPSDRTLLLLKRKQWYIACLFSLDICRIDHQSYRNGAIGLPKIGV